MPRRTLSQALLTAALLLGPGEARLSAQPAQPTPPAPAVSAQAAPVRPPPMLMDAAKRHHDDGVKFYEAGAYDAARVEFEACQISRARSILNCLMS